MPGKVPFKEIAGAALLRADELVMSWCPGGTLNGREYLPLNPTRGDNSPGSFSINLNTGLWKDFATDETGGDLISLYAYIYSVSQVDAANTLANICGITLSDIKPTPGQPGVSKKRRPDSHWTFHEADGSKYFQVHRWEATDSSKKVIRPAMRDPSNPKKLIYKWPSGLLPLYDRHLLANNENIGKTVLIVEGEKAMDAGRERTQGINKLFITTWAGGSSNIKKQDWAALRGRKVLLLPDNDSPGRKAMLKVGYLLEHEGAASVYILDPPHSKKSSGWDIGDWQEKVDGPMVEWLREAATTYRYKPADYDEKLKHPAGKEQSPIRNVDDELLPVRCLGMYRRKQETIDYYLLSHHTGSLLTMQPKHMVDSGLLQLAPYEAWEGLAKSSNGGVAWKKARNTIMELCRKRGHIDIGTLLRGRGVWAARNGQVYIHAGNKLFTGSSWIDPTRHPENIMEARPPLDLGEVEIAEPEQLAHVYKTYEHLKWVGAWMPKFMHGWVLAAPFSGLLDWRTHCILTGPSGSGKTTVNKDLIGKCLGNIPIRLEGASTESGVRRTMGVEALPVVFDENEKEGRSDRAGQVVKEILHLARVSSSESGGYIRHGDGNIYRPRSMFLFNWIDPAMHDEGDQNRFVICELQRLEGDWQKGLNLFNDKIALIEPDYWRKAFWWTYRNIDKWVEATKIFKDVYAKAHRSPRKADTLAPIYALSCLSLHQEVPTYAMAVDFLGGQTDDFGNEMEVVRDEEGLLIALLNSMYRFLTDDGKTSMEYTIGEMIEEVWKEKNIRSGVHRALRRWGAKVRWTNDAESVCFSMSGDGIQKALRGSRWQDGWRKTLERVPGAKKSEAPMAFGNRGTSERYIEVPIRLCLPEKEDAEFEANYGEIEY